VLTLKPSFRQHYNNMNWTIFLVTSLLFSPLLSQMPEFSRLVKGEGAGDYNAPVWNELSLTDAQREEIDQIAVSNEQSTEAILRNVLTAKLALQDAIIRNPNGEGPILSLSTALGYAMTELTMQQARVYSEIVQLLTPAQQRKLSQFANERDSSLQDGFERLSQSGS
jgi:Spy/CpxP family protein refolding chaperone